MIKDLKSTSMKNLIEEVGCAVSVKNMYSIVEPEFTEELDNYYRQNDFENKDIMDFLIRNEKKVNKEKFVMCTLYNYIREKEKNSEKPEYTYYIDDLLLNYTADSYDFNACFFPGVKNLVKAQ